MDLPMTLDAAPIAAIAASLRPLAHAPVVARLIAGEGDIWQPADWLTRAIQAEADPLRAAGMLWRMWSPNSPAARQALAASLRALRSPQPLAEVRAWLRGELPADVLQQADLRVGLLARELLRHLEDPAELLPLLELREHIADLCVALHLAGRPATLDTQALDALAKTCLRRSPPRSIVLSTDWNERLWQVSISQPDAWWCAYRLVD
jgi:hypothetical protein